MNTIPYAESEVRNNKMFNFQAKKFRKGRLRKGRRNGSSAAQPPAKQRDFSNQVVERSMPLFPARFKAILRYADTYTLNSTSGAVASQVISCNGLYDPDITGTGHQPAGFDQMMLSYEHYVGLNARITATFHCNTNGAYPNCAVSVNAASTPVTVINQLMEDGYIITERMMGLAVVGSIRTLETRCNVAKFCGVDDIMDNDDYRGTSAANPGEQAYFILQTWSTENVTSSCSVDVVVEYEAMFIEPKRITQSMTRAIHKLMLAEQRGQSPEVLVDAGCSTSSDLQVITLHRDAEHKCDNCPPVRRK